MGESTQWRKTEAAAILRRPQGFPESRPAWSEFPRCPSSMRLQLLLTSASDQCDARRNALGHSESDFRAVENRRGDSASATYCARSGSRDCVRHGHVRHDSVGPRPKPSCPRSGQRSRLRLSVDCETWFSLRKMVFELLVKKRFLVSALFAFASHSPGRRNRTLPDRLFCNIYIFLALWRRFAPVFMTWVA